MIYLVSPTGGLPFRCNQNGGWAPSAHRRSLFTRFIMSPLMTSVNQTGPAIPAILKSGTPAGEAANGMRIALAVVRVRWTEAERTVPIVNRHEESA